MARKRYEPPPLLRLDCPRCGRRIATLIGDLAGYRRGHPGLEMFELVALMISTGEYQPLNLRNETAEYMAWSYNPNISDRGPNRFLAACPGGRCKFQTVFRGERIAAIFWKTFARGGDRIVLGLDD